MKKLICFLLPVVTGLFVAFHVTAQLRELYMIEFDGNDSVMINELKKSELFYYIKREPKPIPLYEPSDYMWYLGWLWHLEIIKADLAWDITHGNSSVNIAVIDTDFDLIYPDLTNKINPSYDPYTLIQHSVSGGLGNCLPTPVSRLPSLILIPVFLLPYLPIPINNIFGRGEFF